MKNKTATNSMKFNKFSSIALLDGLDTFLNLSIVTYLSIFFFKEFDNRVSILLSTSVVLLSFFSRNSLLCLIEKVLTKSKRADFNLYLMFTVCYFFPLFLTDNLNILSILVFMFSRFVVGNLFFLAKKNYLSGDQFKEENNFFIKYLILFILGMLIGSILFVFLNDIFSNSQMNSWAWKCFYFFLLIVALCFSFLFKYKIMISNNNDSQTSDESLISLKKKNNFFFKNLSSIIPFYLLLVFSCQNWLPRFSNPENMQLLDYGIINIFLILLLTVFTFPLFNLIGNRKVSNFFGILVIVVSLIAFAFEYTSSYSIDFLKFYLSIIASFLISLNVLNLKLKNPSFAKVHLNYLSFIFVTLAILLPLTFYFFINFSISYNIIYLIISFLFLVSFLAGRYDER